MKELEELYVKYSSHIEMIVSKWKFIEENLYFYTIEEMVVELYSTVLQLSTLARITTDYNKMNEKIFLNGHEILDKEFYKKLSGVEKKRKAYINAWLVDNSKNGKKNTLEESYLKVGYEVARIIEREIIKLDLNDENSKSEEAKLAERLDSISSMIKRGLDLKAIEKSGYTYQELLTNEVNVEILSEKYVGVDGMWDKLKLIHGSIMSLFMVYLYMTDYLMIYILTLLSAGGWKRIELLEDSEKVKRFEAAKMEYLQSAVYKERRDNYYAEDLLDEGEPVAEKIYVVRNQFKTSFKTNKLVKQFRLMKESTLDLINYIVEKRISKSEVEDFFYYCGVLDELNTIFPYSSTIYSSKQQLNI